MLLYAERTCIELEEMRIRLRSAYNQEIRDRSDQAMKAASSDAPEPRVGPAVQRLN